MLAQCLSIGIVIDTGVAVDPVGQVLSFGLPFVPARIQEVVIQTLRDQYCVGKAKVDGDGDNSGYETSPDGAGQIRNITQKPDEEKQQ